VVSEMAAIYMSHIHISGKYELLTGNILTLGKTGTQTIRVNQNKKPLK